MIKTPCVACGGELGLWFKRSKFTYFKCLICETVVTLPMPSNRQIMAHYKSKFKNGNYFLLRSFNSSYVRVYQQMAEILSAKFQVMDESILKKSILDVGCFTGDFLVVLKGMGARVYGSELQEEAVSLASKKLPGRIMLSDIGSEDFPKMHFDAVTLLGLIEHVTDPETLLHSTTKVLKKGGVLMIQTPDSGSLFAWLFGKWWPPLAPVEHIHVFSAKGLRQLLERHGYGEIVIQPHVKWLPLAYVYHQFENFGTHFMPFISPFGWLVERIPARLSLPFYGGEMIVTARRSQ